MPADLQKPAVVANQAPSRIAADTEITLSLPAARRQQPTDQAVDTAADIVCTGCNTVFTIYAPAVQPEPSHTSTDEFSSFTTGLRPLAQSMTGQDYTPLSVNLALEPTYGRLSDLVLTYAEHGLAAAEQVAELYHTLTEVEAAEADRFSGNTASAAQHYEAALEFLPKRLLAGPAPHPLVTTLNERLELVRSQE